MLLTQLGLFLDQKIIIDKVNLQNEEKKTDQDLEILKNVNRQLKKIFLLFGIDIFWL